MVQLRPGITTDLDFLKEMLFEAFFWDTSTERPPLASFRDAQEFSKLLADWGRRGDRAVIAEEGSARIGAAWFRLWTPDLHSYGFVNAATPEIAMAVRQDHRSKGIGRRLLHALIQTARADAFPTLSLSVSPLNCARQLYESLGFRKIGESGTSWTLLLSLSPSRPPMELTNKSPKHV
ncbi:MAG TPA: GNAT family N-acetyltransferase [Candidatus Limnocylindrales bacterium]|nr:GNAT family N-acetyltransferase [Candidatus Limnocylindrales bacterium]